MDMPLLEDLEKFSRVVGTMSATELFKIEFGVFKIMEARLNSDSTLSFQLENHLDEHLRGLALKERETLSSFFARRIEEAQVPGSTRSLAEAQLADRILPTAVL